MSPRRANVGTVRGRRQYSAEPQDKRAFSQRFDRRFSRFARVYELAVKHLPLWRKWLQNALPHIHALLAEFDLVALDHEIGGFGGVHLYLATKPTAPRTQPPT
jgi:hypothetical protein